jgi:hypothetical protein
MFDARWGDDPRDADALVHSREREHDLQVYRAYEKAEERLHERRAHVDPSGP